MNEDELKGKFNQVKGRAKQDAGEIMNDGELIEEGAADEAGGELREGYGKTRRKVGDAIEDLGEKMK